MGAGSYFYVSYKVKPLLKYITNILLFSLLLFPPGMLAAIKKLKQKLPQALSFSGFLCGRRD